VHEASSSPASSADFFMRPSPAKKRLSYKPATRASLARC
jgi:hypothetical protein